MYQFRREETAADHGQASETPAAPGIICNFIVLLIIVLAILGPMANLRHTAVVQSLRSGLAEVTDRLYDFPGYTARTLLHGLNSDAEDSH